MGGHPPSFVINPLKNACFNYPHFFHGIYTLHVLHIILKINFYYFPKQV